ncbi:hypothetical protein WME79_08645 [Sorangium sp. So ce726]|uniref:hypothetical protein n=1 Tax=Sorangium sp. So ce726 TaxID=3133319 RepID=UPI003F647D77
MILPPQDAVILGPPIPNVTACLTPPHPGIVGRTSPSAGVEMTLSDPCSYVASIEPPDPHVHALGLALAIALVALRR